MTSTDDARTARSLAPYEAIAALAKLYLQVNRVRPGSVHEQLAKLLFGDLERWVRGGKVPNLQTRHQFRELVEIVDTKAEQQAVENNVAQTLRRLAVGMTRFGYRDSRSIWGERHEEVCEIKNRAQRIRTSTSPDPVRQAIETGINVDACTLPIDGAWKLVHIVGPTSLLRDDEDALYWLDVRFEPAHRTEPAPPLKGRPQPEKTASSFRSDGALAAERESYLRSVLQLLEPRTRYGEYPAFYIERHVTVALNAATTLASGGGVFRVPRTSWSSIRRGIGSAIITGNAGAGKSWLLRRETITYAAEAIQSPEAPIPIHVSLHDVTPSTSHETFLDRLVRAAYGLATRSVAFTEFLKEHIETGNAILLLDDLDEIPTERRHLLEKELQAAIVDLRARIFVACRASAYDNTLPLPELTLDGFLRPEIARYIRERLATNIPARDRALGVIAWQSILDLCRNPLLLSLLTFVAETREELPHTRAKLYDEFLALLLRSGWRDIPRATTVARSKIADAKEEALQLVAEQLANAHLWPRLIDGRELESLLESTHAAMYIRQHSPYATDGAYSLLWELSEKDGVLLMDRASSQRKEMYRFFHPSFHPFLVARRFSALPFDDVMTRLREHVFFDPEPFWADTSILFGGYTGHPDVYIEQLLNLPNILRRPLYLAARTLLECAHDARTEPLRFEISQRLARLARENPYNREFILRTIAHLDCATEDLFDLAFATCTLPTVLELADALPGAAQYVMPREDDSWNEASTIAVVGAAGEVMLLRQLVLLLERRVGGYLDDQAITRGEARNKLVEFTHGLTYIRGEACLDVLHELAESPERRWFIREAIVVALGLLGDPTSIPVIARLLESTDAPDGVRAASASALTGHTSPKSIESLLHVGGDKHVPIEVRAAALSALYGVSADGVKVLLMDAIEDASADIAIAAAGALYPSERYIAASALRDILRRGNARDRRNALLEIGMRGAQELQAEVLKACTDGPTKVRAAAFRAAGDLKLSDAVPEMVHIVHERGEGASERKRSRRDDDEIRSAAIGALGRIGDRAALGTLLDAAKERLDESTIRAVGRFGDADAVRSIISLCREPHLWNSALYEACAAAPIGSLFDDLIALADNDAAPSGVGSWLAMHVTPDHLDALISCAVSATEKDPRRARIFFFPALEQAAHIIQEFVPTRWSAFAKEAERLTNLWDS